MYLEDDTKCGDYTKPLSVSPLNNQVFQTPPHKVFGGFWIPRASDLHCYSVLAVFWQDPMYLTCRWSNILIIDLENPQKISWKHGGKWYDWYVFLDVVFWRGDTRTSKSGILKYPKHLLRRPLRVPNTPKPKVWLEDFGRLGYYSPSVYHHYHLEHSASQSLH